MAKKINLLLKVTLAVVCFSALLLAVALSAATPPPAQAAEMYDYVLSAEKNIPAADVAMIVHKSGTGYYAMTASGSSVTVTEVYLQDNDTKIDASKTNVDNKLLWKIVSAGGTDVEIESLASASYNKLYAYNSVSLSNSASTLDGSTNYLYATNGRAVVGSNSGYAMDDWDSTKFLIFVRQAATGGAEMRYTKTSLTELTVGESVTGILVGNTGTKLTALGVTDSGGFGAARDVFSDGKYLDLSNKNTDENLVKWTAVRTGENQITFCYAGNKSNKGKYLGAGGNFISAESSSSSAVLEFTALENVPYRFYLKGNKYIYFSSSNFQLAASLPTDTTKYQFEFYALTEYVQGETATVSFDKVHTEAAGVMENVTRDYGDYYLPVCAFTLANYKFAGWQVNGEGDTLPVGAAINLTENITLKAVWDYNCIDVTYRMDGKEDVVKSYTKNSSGLNYWKAPDVSDIFTDYQVGEDEYFLGWKSGDTLYVAGNSTNIKENLVLTAELTQSVTIRFDANGGEFNSDTYKNDIKGGVGQKYRLPSQSSAAKQGYVLKGFTVGQDETIVSCGSTIDITADTVITAQWKFDGYSLHFVVEGETVYTAEIARTSTSYSIDVNDPVKEGYKFLGWLLDNGTTYLKKGGIIYRSTLEKLDNEEGTLVAQFEKIEYVNVIFHLGTKTETVEIEKSTTSTNFNLLSVDTYFSDWKEYGDRFEGWATNPELTGTFVSNGWKIISEDTHYYAVVVQSYTVTFVYGTGVDDDTRSGTERNPVAVPYDGEKTRRERYTFMGWTSAEGGAVVEYEAKYGVTVDHECTLYAVWRYDYKKVVIEVVNDGKTEIIDTEVLMRDKTQFTLDEVLTELTDAQKELFAVSEHRTAKWVNTADMREISATDKITYPAGKDEQTGEDKFVTLRVTITDKLYTIKFEQPGDKPIESIQAKFGADISGLKPADPVRAGYEFISWNLEGKVFDWTTMPGKNISLVGIWKALPSTLKFDLNGGTTADGAAYLTDITLNSAERFDKPANPVKEGYDFVCWTLNGEEYRWTKADTTETYYGTMPGGTNTLVAVWELNHENRVALKEELTAAMTAYAREKGVEVPLNDMDKPATDTEAKIRKIYADVIEIIDYKAAVLDEVNAYAQRFNITLTASETFALRDAKDKTAADEQKALLKSLVDIRVLAAAKADAKAAIEAAATENGVEAPDVNAQIDEAATIDEVNEIKAAALAEIVLNKAKADAKAELSAYAAEKKVSAPASLAEAIDKAATKQAVAEALTAGKAEIDRLAGSLTPTPDEDKEVTQAKAAVTAAVNASGVKDAIDKIAKAQAAIEKLTAEQKEQLDLTAFNVKIAEVEAKVNGAKADLEGARKVANSVVFSVTAAAAMLAFAAWIAKRRTF